MKSLIESIIDVGSGFILAILIQVFCFPLFGLYPSILDSIGIALIFTGVSISRSWLWRLAFQKYNKKYYFVFNKHKKSYDRFVE